MGNSQVRSPQNSRELLQFIIVRKKGRKQRTWKGIRKRSKTKLAYRGQEMAVQRWLGL